MQQKVLDPNNPPTGLPPRVGDRFYYPIVRLSSVQLSVEAGAAMGLPAIGLTMDAGYRHFLVRFDATHPIVKGVDGRPEFAAFGRSITCKVTGAQSELSLSTAVANATVGVSTNSLSARTNGIPIVAAQPILGMDGGALDATNMDDFGLNLARVVGWCVDQSAAVGSEAKPGAVFSLVDVPIDRVRSCMFALNQIAKGRDLQGALADLRAVFGKKKTRRKLQGVDEVVLASAYHRFKFGDAPAAAIAAARALLNGADGALAPATNGAAVGYRIDVLPYVTGNNAAVSLLSYASDARARIGVWPPTLSDLSAADIAIGISNAHAALRMGMSYLVDVNADTDIGFVSTGWGAEYARAGLPGTLIRTEHYLVAARAALRYDASNGELTAATVSAKASMKQLASSAEVEILGIDLGDISAVAGIVGTALHGYDPATQAAVGGLMRQINERIADQDTRLRPVLCALTVDLGADEIQGLSAGLVEFCQSLGAIKARRSRASIPHVGGEPDANWVAVYNLVGVIDRPTAAQAKIAEGILDAGS